MELMQKSSLTRRGFVKLAGATIAASALGAASEVSYADESGYAKEVSGNTKVVRTCCRACGKNECGVLVTVVDGRAVKVEGDEETAFHSMGNCCAKSQSSMLAAYHPDRLYHPMKRTNPKGSSDPGWQRITWDEAMETLVDKFKELQARYGGESMFFIGGTSRIWCQHPYRGWGILVDSPNAILAWQICKGPRHWATTMVSEYAYSWMATTDRPRVLVSWGGASEISNYDESGRTTVQLANQADAYISVDPRLTNLGHEADQHQYLKPGTDGALALAWTNVIIENKLYDDLYVKRWTDAPFLVVEGMEPSGVTPIKTKMQVVPGWPMKTRLLKEYDLKEGGSDLRFMVYDELAGTDDDHPLHQNDPTGKLTYFDAETGLWEGEEDTVWDQFYESPQPNLPEGVVPGRIAVASPFDPEIDPALYGEFQVTLKDGTTHSMKPVWEHYRAEAAKYEPEKAAEITGISADDIRKAALTYATRIDPSTGYGNGGLQYMLAAEHACNSIQNNRMFDAIVGITGNFDTPAGNRGPTTGWWRGSSQTQGNGYNKSDSGFKDWDSKVLGCDDLPLLSWWQFWADADHVYKACLTSDPYPVRGGLCEASDFMNQSNATQNYQALLSLDFFVVMDLWKTPTTGAADLLLPATHWMETTYPRISQGSTGAQGATVAAIDPPADCRLDTQVCVDAYKLWGKPWVDPDNAAAQFFGEGNYWPTMDELFSYTIQDSGMKWDEYVKAFEEHGWWDCRAIAPETWGTYRRYETGQCSAWKTPNGNPMRGFSTPTRKQEIWSTVAETYMPDAGYELPTWEEAPENEGTDPEYCQEYPLLMTTGRRIPVYFHSEHRQLPWCRELWPVPRTEINPVDAEKLGVEQGDWVWIETPRGKVRQTVDLYYGIEPGVINCEHQWWYPELDQADKGFALSTINCLVEGTHQDPMCGSSHLRAYHVKVYKATSENSPFNDPIPCGEDGTEIIHDSSDPRLKEWMPDYEIREEQ